MAQHGQRGFRVTLTIVGIVYALLASSMLVRGPEVLGEFGVSPSLYKEAVLRDFFMFFYQLMAGTGVLIMLLGHVARERSTQLTVASVLSAANVLVALRDLSTSDSTFGNHLYRGPKTLVFVYISLALALIFTVLAVLTARGATSAPRKGPPSACD
jgi:hypothetical protein